MKTNSKILLAVAAGAIVGTTLILLLAPQKGIDLKKGFKEKSKKLSSDVKDVFAGMKEKFTEARENYRKPEPVS